MSAFPLGSLYSWLDRIPGPDFLALYVTLLAVVTAVSVVVGRATRPRPTREPDLFELAWLGQGPAGVVVASHLIADAPRAPFVPARLAGTQDRQVWAAAQSPVHARIQAARPGLAWESARSQAVSAGLRPVIQEVEDGLRRDGFLRPRPNPAVAVTTFLYLALLGFGALRLLRGLARDRPSGYLALLLVLTLVLLLWRLRRSRRNPAVGRMLTRLRQVHGVRADSGTLSDAAGVPTTPLPVAYALGGGALLWGVAPALANDYQVSATASAASSGNAYSCGGGGGSDSGGSDGGGSDGGGGCGGCGGGD